jgi:hypothetical protein
VLRAKARGFGHSVNSHSSCRHPIAL